MDIREMPIHVRPRERLMQGSAKVLTDAELLAILLGSGTTKMPVLTLAEYILEKSGGLGHLPEMTVQQAMQIHGVGPGKACTILATAEVGRRIALQRSELNIQRITGSADASKLFFNAMERYEQEVFLGMFLDVKHHILAIEELFVGTAGQALVHPRDLYRQAVRYNAYAVLVAHNHPSGDVSPSSEDLLLTRRLAKAGEILGVELLDHIIICNDAQRYYSFKEHEAF